jgi:8-oxo-dGTP diphosphatase
MEESMNHAVVGFMFDPQGKNVVLINKNRPEWQRGMWNGPGGKVRMGQESAREAMAREFREEAGVDTDSSQWVIVVVMNGVDKEGKEWAITFMYSCAEHGIEEAKTVTDERVEVFPVGKLPDNLVRGLRWIIPLCLDNIYFPLMVISK